MKTELKGPVRVRFAPSPTGYLHVGGARTAIYNELLRQSLGGCHILRIEDTDKARSDEAMTSQIVAALRWIGVEWDEGPVLQSAGLERHRAAARQLLAEGKAYHDFVPPAEVEARRQEAQRKKENFRYKDCFAPPPKAEVERRLEAGEPYAVRFRMPEEPIVVRDLVRGEVTFGREHLDDLIILRSDGTPTYHMSVVCDDVAMAITHVIRGEDHLSNTPKHVALFRAFGAPVPAFGHLPLILGPGKKRLSKRTGATSVEEFRARGILPQALYNYLALLGWSPGDGREIMSREEMIAAFTVERLGSSAAVFDHDKLAWMNAQYMSRLPLPEILAHLQPFVDRLGLGGVDGERLAGAVDLHRTRAKTLEELAGFLVPYFQDSLEYDREACARFLAQEDLPDHLEALIGRLRRLPSFDADSIEAALRGLADERGLKAGVLIHPTRMALTASKAGPSLFELVAAMGQSATLRHLANFVRFLRSAPTAGP
ncbi:MAG: glutamate--tRNA ligase [Acidobacteria bacterium]|nr:MAG: glutamate--tRNA ligase [Acidobacteriota bacterium]